MNPALLPLMVPEGTSPSKKVVEVLLHAPEVPSTCRQSDALPVAPSIAPVASITADREIPKDVPSAGRTFRAFCRPVTSPILMMVTTAGADPLTDPGASSTSRTRKLMLLGGTAQASLNCVTPKLVN